MYTLKYQTSIYVQHDVIQSWWVTLANAIAIKSPGDDVVRNTCSLARIEYLTLEKTSSSGIKSGLYGGRKRVHIFSSTHAHYSNC